MPNEVKTVEIRSQEPGDVFGGYRPNELTIIEESTGRVFFPLNENVFGVPMIPNAAAMGYRVQSFLMEDEWQMIDREVIAASEYPLRVVNDIRAAGLVVPVGPDVLSSTWYTQGDMTGATTNMLGRSMGERDIPEIRPAGAPIPMTYKDLSFSTRGIGASRRIGQGIDLTMVSLGSRVIAERLESLLINGDTSLVFNGQTLYGLLTEPNVTTDTASNFGGGDWGTAGNPEKTIAGMINSLNGENYRGPFTVYVSETQYNQAAYTYHTDGTGNTALDRINRWDSVRAILPLPAASLADGKIIVAQMTRDVIEWAEGSTIQVREWQSGNGMEVFFRIMAIGGPRIKARQNGESGIRVATGA